MSNHVTITEGATGRIMIFFDNKWYYCHKENMKWIIEEEVK